MSLASLQMTASLLTFERHTRARLQALAWHARRHARDSDEALQVERLCQAVQQGHVAPLDAHKTLSALRGQQQAAV